MGSPEFTSASMHWRKVGEEGTATKPGASLKKTSRRSDSMASKLDLPVHNRPTQALSRLLVAMPPWPEMGKRGSIYLVDLGKAFKVLPDQRQSRLRCRIVGQA